MERFDERLKTMAEQEACAVPEGFDGRLQETLNSLPPQGKKRRGLGVIKGVVIAAAVCAALVGTALAASPGLRELLSAALGGFAPYAQEQEDKTYLLDGFEVKVLSTLSDGSTLRAYVQVRDLEGERLSADMKPCGSVDVMTEADERGKGAERSFSTDFGHAVYDEESKTALLVFTSWAQGLGDLSNARLRIWNIYDFDSMVNDVYLTIPLEVESMPKLAFEPDSEIVTSLGAKSLELSPLGLTGMFLMENDTEAIFMRPVRVCMTDGTEVRYEERDRGMPTGMGTCVDRETRKRSWIYVWNFAEPLDLDDVAGIYVGEDYFPVS